MKKKNILKKIGLVCMASVMALSAAGCLVNKQTDGTGTKTSVLGFTVTSDVSYTITDWTMDEFLSDIRIYGKEMNLSGTPTDIGSDFLLENPVRNDTFGITEYDVTYNGGKIASLITMSGEEDSLDSRISHVTFSNLGKYTEEEFSVMNIKGNSSSAWIEEMLGESNVIFEAKDKSLLTYVFPQEGEIAFVFDYAGKLESINITFMLM